MKKWWILAGAGLGLAALGAAVGIHHDPTATTTGRPGAATRGEPVSRDRVRTSRPDVTGARSLDELLAGGSPAAWGEIVSLYAGSETEKKRKVLASISKVARFEDVVAYLLATVGEDPTPAEHDPMIEEAAAVLGSRIKTAAEFDHARRAMVMQETDKRRWVLANALASFAAGAGDGAYKGQLAAKLIDLHSETRDPYVKNQIVDAVRSLGEADAALILAEGPNIEDEDLEGVREQTAARDQALRGSGLP